MSATKEAHSQTPTKKHSIGRFPIFNLFSLTSDARPDAAQFSDLSNDAPNEERASQHQPSIESTPQTFVKEVGSEVTFPCKATDLGESGISWTKVGTDRKTNSVIYLVGTMISQDLRINVAKDLSLSIKSLSTNDTGTYVCKVADSNYDINVAHVLTVKG